MELRDFKVNKPFVFNYEHTDYTAGITKINGRRLYTLTVMREGERVELSKYIQLDLGDIRRVCVMILDPSKQVLFTLYKEDCDVYMGTIRRINLLRNIKSCFVPTEGLK